MDSILAIDTYGSQRVRDPQQGGMISAYKLSYTSAASAVLLALLSDRAHDVSSKQASYHYLHIDGEVTVRHGYILVKATAAEVERVAVVTRRFHRAGVCLWRDSAWWEFPTSQSTDYVPAGRGAAPNFNPTGYLVVSATTGEKEAAVTGIAVEKSQRSPNEKAWFWLTGETYPHRELLKQHGARFSGRRKAWYYVGWSLPEAIEQLVGSSTESAEMDQDAVEPIEAGAMSPQLQRHILDVLAEDDAATGAQANGSEVTVRSDPPQADTLREVETDQSLPSIRITKPAPLDDSASDVIRAVIQRVKSLPTASEPIIRMASSNRTLTPIPQAFVGELTGSITGNVYCYGYAVHNGTAIYINCGGPRMAVEAIRAKLSKGDMVSCVPYDAPAIELTAGEGNTGMYHAFLQNIPEAKFTSLILVHDLAVHPNYGGKSTTYLFRVSEAQAIAQLKHHITELVNVPVFDAWSAYLWEAGQAAQLVRKARCEGGIEVMSVDLDAEGWTRLITGGLDQRIVELPH